MKARIGIVGGGQLGRMLTLAAKRLGFYVTVIDPTPKSPAGQVADTQIVAGYEDGSAIRELARVSDFVTFEIELASAATLHRLSQAGVKVNPSAQTLAMIKDKYRQSRFFQRRNIPVAAFRKVSTPADVLKASKQFGFPLMLKARTDAYDGRGNALVGSTREIARGWKKLGGRKLYVEQYIHFIKELAVMVVRDVRGHVAVYPVVETVHKNNICHTVLAPAPIPPAAARKARDIALRVVKHLRGAGVFGIEMFLTKTGEVVVNEIAPRVHNSGHYTIEACATSQFEQHVRAITGLPLGKTDLVVPAAVMVNILGRKRGASLPKGLAQALAVPFTRLHIYGKKESRPERKMGHITAIGKNLRQAHRRAARARAVLDI